MPKVDFDWDNLKSCRCPVCPVQSPSACVKVEKELVKKEMMAQSDPPALPKPEDTPEIYCSHGKATCKDLDPEESCFCPTCPVWVKDSLVSTYYCQDGSADEIG